ncbi:hypothetical protein K438DRAFT_1844125 [Mycena galopus ATCC 62051]|nr:hypothetical protein K438DRAFT_1844125 [Mycena galopus ATCC 62051]
MTFSLLGLPTELLLIILGEICEIRYLPSRKDTFRSIAGLHSLSKVNRILRSLSLPILFETTRCTSSQRLEELIAECTSNTRFAGLIRQLDVWDIGTQHLLPELVARLTSLVRLDLSADALDARLLTAINSHPFLTTVAVQGSRSQLETLMNIVRSTDLSFSKLLLSTILRDLKSPLSPGIFSAVAQRGARFSRLNLRNKIIFENQSVFDKSSLPNLAHLELFFVYHRSNSSGIQSWLLPFAQRHTNLTTVKFTYGCGNWGSISDVPFANDFLAATSSENIWGFDLESFSIMRPASEWSSLKDWNVVQIQLKLRYTDRISVLKWASALAPHLSILELFLEPSRHTYPCHIDKFVLPFALVPSLRILHLSHGYTNLGINGRSPWIHSQPANMRTRLGSSTGVTALHALQWYMTRVAQQATGLEIIHVTDSGLDGAARARAATPWSLEASFRVLANEGRDLELLGSPKLQMAAKYLPKSKV